MSAAAQELPHDPMLPQLAVALDGEAMRAVFAPALPLPPAACRVERVKYRPRRNLAVTYRLECRNPDGSTFEQRVATRFCSGGESANRHAKAQAHPLGPSAGGPQVTLHPALDMVAHWWPNDPKLAAAGALADSPALRERWLPEVVRVLSGGRARFREARFELIQVVPEHRATARVELELDDGRTECVYAKADAEQRGPHLQAILHALWHSPAQRVGALITPRPLLWQPGSGLHWQAALPGRPLLDLSPHVDAAIAAQVGGMLAALHRTPVQAARELSAAELRQRPHDVTRILALVEPAWTAPLGALLAALCRPFGELLASPRATLHGDLHPRNLLRTEAGGLGLIDLDGAAYGPSVLDLGSWVADTVFRARLEGTGAAGALAGSRAFLEAHAAAGGQRPSEALLAWATAYQLLCERAWRCVVNLKPGRYRHVPGLIALALRILRAGHIDAMAEDGELVS